MNNLTQKLYEPNEPVPKVFGLKCHLLTKVNVYFQTAGGCCRRLRCFQYKQENSSGRERAASALVDANTAVGVEDCSYFSTCRHSSPCDNDNYKNHREGMDKRADFTGIFVPCFIHLFTNSENKSVWEPHKSQSLIIQ